MDNEVIKEFENKIYRYETALEDLLRMSKMYEGDSFNMRLNNMVITRFPYLAKKLKEIKQHDQSA